MQMTSWMILSPLLIGIGLVGFALWQLIQEIKTSLKQMKSLQEELDRAKKNVAATVPEIQNLVANAKEGAEEGRILVAESKEIYAKVRTVTDVVRNFDTTPVRQGIAFIRYKREERRIQKFPEKLHSWLDR